MLALFLKEIQTFFLKDFIYLLLERGERREKEERNISVVASCIPANGNLACNPVMCPDWESNRQLFGSQAGAQSTGPHQPGHKCCWLLSCLPLREN